MNKLPLKQEDLPENYIRTSKRIEILSRKLARMEGSDHATDKEASNNWKKLKAKIDKLELHRERQLDYYLKCKAKEQRKKISMS